MPTKQKSGKYRTKIVIGHDENGKPINKWISAATKKELENKRREVREHYIDGIGSDPDATFGAYAKEWFEIKKKPFVSPGTQQLYASALNAHILPAFKDRKLRSVTNMDVQRYFNTLSELSRARVESILMVIHAVFAGAVADGLITRNPAQNIRIDATPAREKYVLTAADRAAVERVCETHPDGLLLALLYYTGMRDGEMMALTWKDISFRDRVIHIHSSIKNTNGTFVGPTKTRSSVRDVPIPEPLMNILRSVPVGMPDSMVIHCARKTGPINPVQLRVRWSHLMEAANLGVPGDGPHGIKFIAAFTPHTLRHNYTTMLYENGVDPYTAAKLLGHSSITTTMNIYTHFSQTAMDTARDKLDTIFTHTEEVAK